MTHTYTAVQEIWYRRIYNQGSFGLDPDQGTSSIKQVINKIGAQTPDIALAQIALAKTVERAIKQSIRLRDKRGKDLIAQH